MNQQRARLLLIAVICTRACALLFTKVLLVDMGPFSLLGVRFLLAFALLLVLLWRRLPRLNARLFVYGLVLGAGFFVVMSLETFSLRLTSTSHVAFLENCAIIFVPLGEALLARRLPGRAVCLGSLAALLGIGLICVGGGGAGVVAVSGAGDALALGAAVFYALVIMLCTRMSRREDALALGVLQVGWIGAFALVSALVLGEPVRISGAAQWGCLAFLSICCTGFGFTLQPLAQRHLSSEQVSLTLAVDPLVASALGILVLHEDVGLAGLAGMGLILAAILASCLPEARWNSTPGEKRSTGSNAPRAYSSSNAPV